jgi:hypothetical protein
VQLLIEAFDELRALFFAKFIAVNFGAHASVASQTSDHSCHVRQ